MINVSIDKFRELGLCTNCAKALKKQHLQGLREDENEQREKDYLNYYNSVLEGRDKIGIKLCPTCAETTSKCCQCGSYFLVRDYLKKVSKSLVRTTSICRNCSGRTLNDSRLYFLFPTVKLSTLESKQFVNSLHN